ncbi:MAG TPA: glycoside hydrolase family 31 protein, partial [Candidatus Hydrogenedentes bacterium]|nr:glycoside hydrolase family 31 protein [Candidatus Hydrogenedentota bacterium]
SLLVAPLFGEATTRKLWLPKGNWFDFWTGAAFEGGKEHEITADTDTLPVFVKAGSLIPLADPVSHITKETVFQLEVRAYGAPPASFELPEDDGVSTLPADGNIATVRLDWPRKGKPRMIRTGDGTLRRYEIREWLRFDKQG